MKLYQSTVLLLLVAQLSCHGQKEGFVQDNSAAPIHYKTFGSPAKPLKPLLIINGGPGMNCNGFEELAKTLSKNNLTIIYDQRGTGASTLAVLDTSTITMALMAEDVERLRKHLKIEKWSVLGHSFGGMLASYYATKYPERIDKMVLSSSGGIDLGLLAYIANAINAKLTEAEQDSVLAWNQRIGRGDTSHYARLQRGNYLAHAYVLRKEYLPVIAERLTQSNGTVNQLVWTDLQKIKFNCAEKLAAFNRPVLIIQGKEDIVKAETAEKAHSVLKNSRLVYVEQCIHYGWIDNEAVYLKELGSFLAANK